MARPSQKRLAAVCKVASTAHAVAGHPERPQRFEHLAQALEDLPCERVDPLEVTQGHLEAVHPPAYLARLQAAVAEAPTFLDPDTYVTPASWEAALQAVGGALAVTQAVLDGRAGVGFALVRPPGHHATPDRAMGFCLLNNIAIAARFAQSRGAERIMIVDFDVHHGNGTQAVFETDPSVLFLSTHQWGIYPGTGHWEETGRGEGAGTVINVPLPAGAGDRAVEQVCDMLLPVAAERFQPDLLLVSAGYDAHWRDPLAGLLWTERAYHLLGKRLASLAQKHCQGRLAFVLEGGYDPEALAAGVRATLRGALNIPEEHASLGPPPYPEQDASDWIDRVRRVHRF